MVLGLESRTLPEGDWETVSVPSQSSFSPGEELKGCWNEVCLA